jgi:hypothetical protein
MRLKEFEHPAANFKELRSESAGHLPPEAHNLPPEGVEERTVELYAGILGHWGQSLWMITKMVLRFLTP